MTDKHVFIDLNSLMDMVNIFLNIDTVLIVFDTLTDLILLSQSTIFHLCRDGFAWVEPVLSKDYCVLLKDTMQ